GGIRQVLADQAVVGRTIDHVGNDQAGAVAELGVCQVERHVVERTSASVVGGGGALCLDGGDQCSDSGVQLILQDGLCQVAADDLDRLGRGLLDPGQLTGLPDDGTEAAGHLDVDRLQLLERGRAGGGVG